MPIPAKPCDGRFSDEVQEVLKRNRDRDQWANHPCEVCGVAVGAKLDKGKWVPEQHWPTVKYIRNTTEKKRGSSSRTMVSNDDAVDAVDAVVAEFASS